MFQKAAFKNISSSRYTQNSNQVKLSNHSLDRVLQNDDLKDVSQLLTAEKLSQKLFVNYSTEEWEEYENVNKNIRDLNKQIDHEVEVLKKTW